jgi:hypothetical protein
MEQLQLTQSSLRKVLLKVLVDRSEFDRLCIDNFPTLAQKINQQLSLHEAINFLFKYISPEEILKCIESEDDWAERLEKCRHLLVFKSLQTSSLRDIHPITIDSIALHGLICEGGQLPPDVTPSNQLILTRSDNENTRRAPRAEAKVGLPLLTSRTLWLFPVVVLLSSATWGFVARFHTVVPLEAAPNAAPPDLALVSAIGTSAPSAIAENSLDTGKRKPILGPPRVPQAESAHIRLHPPKSLPKPQSIGQQRPAKTSCDNSWCFATGTNEHFESLLHEGIEACRDNNQSEARYKYEQLGADLARQRKMKDSCSQNNLEF